MIDKDIEIVKEHIDEMIHKAITVKYENEELKILQTIIKEQQKELEIYKKIAEKLANRLATKSDDCFFCENYNGSKCEIYENRTQCNIEWARNEVEKDVKD